MRTFNPRRAALAAVGGIVLSLFGGASQSAVLKTGYYTIDAMAMAPAGASFETDYSIVWTDGIRNAAPDKTCFNTAVNLPNGATVTKVSVWYTAAAVAGSLNFGGLVRHAVADGNTHYLAEADLGPTANKRVAAALKLYPQPALVPTTLKIDNARFSYAFAVCLVGQSKAAFHAARIIYTYLD